MMIEIIAAVDLFLPDAKYIMASKSNIPEKIKKVILVPTAGMLINVGTNVPMMLPIVFAAFR